MEILNQTTIRMIPMAREFIFEVRRSGQRIRHAKIIYHGNHGNSQGSEPMIIRQDQKLTMKQFI